MMDLKKTLKKLYLKVATSSERAFNPLSIILEVTHRCNLRCSMCLRDSIEVGKQDLTLEGFKHILGEIPSARNIGIMGIGETLMNPDFYEMFDYSLYLGKKMSITTNGTLLSEKNIKRLEGVDSIVVSIDSPEPEKYRAIRGFDLDVVKGNLKNIKKYSNDTKIIIQSVLMKDNINDVKNLLLLAKEVGADTLNLLHLLAADERHAADHAHYCSELSPHMKEAEAIAGSLGIALNSRPDSPEFKSCHLAWNAPFITMSGDIYPCCFIKRAPVDVIEEWYMDTGITVPVSDYRMGNLFEQSFKDIWNNESFRNVRREIITSRNKFKGTRLSPEELNSIRLKYDGKGASYCGVCLFQWMCAC